MAWLLNERGKKNTMNILVTGAAGFIGSHLCDRLLTQGHNIWGVDNLSLGKLENIEHLSSRKDFIFKKLELSDSDELSKFIEGQSIETVFHFAANSDIQKGITKTDLDLNYNLLTTYTVLESMRLHEISDIVFSSTSAIYGRVKGQISEDYGPLFPTSLYGASKLGSEGLISAFCELFNFRAWIVRFPNVVGGRLTHGVIFDFLNKLKGNMEILEILGDGNQRKPYLHVDDLLDAILLLYDKKGNKINYFNVGVESSTSVDEIANIVISNYGNSNTKKIFTGGSIGWPGDVSSFKYNLDKIKDLGWSSSLTSTQAVERAVKENIK